MPLGHLPRYLVTLVYWLFWTPMSRLIFNKAFFFLIMGLPWGKQALWAAQGTVSSIHSVSCLCFENGYIFAHFMCVHSISILLVLVFLAIYRPLVQLSWYLCFSVWKFDSLSWTCTVWSLTFTRRVPSVLEPLTVLVHIFNPSLWKTETRRLQNSRLAKIA